MNGDVKIADFGIAESWGADCQATDDDAGRIMKAWYAADVTELAIITAYSRFPLQRHPAVHEPRDYSGAAMR